MTRPADPPAPEFAYTLQSLASYLGLGNMTAESAWRFLAERERLLRGAMSLLETHKSNAATAEDAIRERIAALSRESLAPREATAEEVQASAARMKSKHAKSLEKLAVNDGREASVPVEAPREPTDEEVLSWVAKDRMLSGLHYDDAYERQRIEHHRALWHRTHPRTPKHSAGVPVEALRALVAKWRRRVSLEIDDPETSDALHECAEDFAALLARPEEPKP